MPRVSVIIPVYGVERWLDACLGSVCAQTLGDIEVICVDDASPDACPATLDLWAERDQRIQAIHLAENRGQGHARNVGLERAAGDYVYFLDADDMVEPRALEELVAIADADALDGVLFDMRVVFDTPELAVSCRFDPDERTGSHPLGVVSGQTLFVSFFSQGDWTCYVQRQFWRRGFLEREGVRFPDWAPHEDEPFSFEAILLASRVRYCPQRWFVRRYREGSAMTSGLGSRNLLCYVRDFLRMARFVRGRGIALPEAQEVIDGIFRRALEVYERLGNDPTVLHGLFEDAGCLDAGLVFCESQRPHVPAGYLGDATVAALRHRPRAYVYGAGVISRRVDEAVRACGLAHDGFIVTSMEGNPSCLDGHRVMQVDSVSPEGAIAVVAVSSRMRAEVERALDERGWDHVYYKE